MVVASETLREVHGQGTARRDHGALRFEMTDSFEILRRFESDYTRRTLLTDADREVVDREFESMLQSISRFADAESADRDLQRLGALQEILATLAFKHGARLTSRQQAFVAQYDRCDVPEVRIEAFVAIKRNEFPRIPAGG